MMISASTAGRYIAPSPNRREVVHEDGGIREIIDVIMYADRAGHPFTRELAPRLVGANDYETLANIWKFTRTHIRYVRDRVGEEVVKSPGKFWADKRGDCKSFSVFIGSLLQNLNFKYKYRVAFYDPNNPDSGHIYPVAMIGGEEVIVDAVHTRFDEEVPYWKAYDYNPNTGKKISRLHGLPTATSQAATSKQFGWLAVAAIALIGGIKLLSK